MSLQHVLLGMLYKKGPQSGYELNKSLHTVTRYFWEADQSRIYRRLNELCDQGWVTFETVIQEHNPNKKVYSITDDGLKELRSWLSEPGKLMSENPRNPFLVQLHFSEAISPEVQRYVIEDRLAALKEELRALEEQAEKLSFPIPFAEDALLAGLPRGELTLDYGIERYRFEIQWTERILGMLQQVARENIQTEV
jgi:DNA-binding PadR family transcriptional regulator